MKTIETSFYFTGSFLECYLLFIAKEEYWDKFNHRQTMWM